MATSDTLQLISILVSSFISVCSIIIAIFTLRQNKKINQESNRAYIVFYIDSNPRYSSYKLVLRNFGKTSGRVINIKLDPILSFDKSNYDINFKTIADCKNIYLAPNQYIVSEFPLNKYKEDKFKVEVKYETLSKIIIESYDIDLTYTNTILYTQPEIKDNLDALGDINRSIQSISDKLL